MQDSEYKAASLTRYSHCLPYTRLASIYSPCDPFDFLPTRPLRPSAVSERDFNQTGIPGFPTSTSLIILSGTTCLRAGECPGYALVAGAGEVGGRNASFQKSPSVIPRTCHLTALPPFQPAPVSRPWGCRAWEPGQRKRRAGGALFLDPP